MDSTEKQRKKKKSPKKNWQDIEDPELVVVDPEETEEDEGPSRKKKKKKASKEDGYDLPVPIQSTSKASNSKAPVPVSHPSTNKNQKTKVGKRNTSAPNSSTTSSSNVINLTNVEGGDEERQKFSGMQILAQMSSDDIDELLNRIGLQCPIDDTKRDKQREAQINWGEISFSCYGPVQCKLVWSYLRSQARTYRILNEIVDEVRVSFKSGYQKYMRRIIESCPEFPKQPYASGGFQYYCKELWDKYKDVQVRMNAKTENFLMFQEKCYEEWQNLNAETKEEYNQKAKELTASYKKQVKEFYAKYPAVAPRFDKLDKDGNLEKTKDISAVYRRQALKMSQELYKDAPEFPSTPLQLFVTSKLNRLDPPPTVNEIPDLKTHYVEKWKNLSDAKRLKWIKSCIKKSDRYLAEVQEYKKAHPLYLLPKELKMSRLISKEEFNIWGKANGHPPKPRVTSFDMFLDEFRNDDEALGKDDAEVRKLATAKWEGLDWYRKDMYKMKHRMEQLTFKKDFEAYYSKLPELLKPAALETVPKKFRKAILDEVGKTPLVLPDEEPEAVNGKSKGHNVEASTCGESSQDEDNGSSKKKKKRKKESQVNETSQGTSSGNAPNAIPLYMMELTDEHKKLIEEKLKEERAAQKKTRKSKTKGTNETSEISTEETTSKKKERSTREKDVVTYLSGQTITQKMLGEAIRGIFDGHQMFRRFSVYYYYAKYVIQKEMCWVKMVQDCGIIRAAGTIIETFHRLHKHQQKTFLDEASEFHMTTRKHKFISSDEDLFVPSIQKFPEEPLPPPSDAEALFRQEVKKQRAESDTEKTWESLDDATQMLYMKKLYRLNREYIMKYEKFIKGMTPNDLVEYLIQRSKDWSGQKIRSYKPNAQSIEWLKLFTAFRVNAKFGSETYRAELSDDEQELEPELYDMNGAITNVMSQPAFKFRSNPFKEKSSPINRIVRRNDTMELKNLRWKLRARAKRRKNKPEPKSIDAADSDLPSSTDEEDENLNLVPNLVKYFKEKKQRKKLRELRRYQYPVEDLYDFSYTATPPSVSNTSLKGRIREAKKQLGAAKSSITERQTRTRKTPQKTSLQRGKQTTKSTRKPTVLKRVEKLRQKTTKYAVSKVKRRSKPKVVLPKQIPPYHQSEENIPGTVTPEEIPISSNDEGEILERNTDRDHSDLPRTPSLMLVKSSQSPIKTSSSRSRPVSMSESPSKSDEYSQMLREEGIMDIFKSQIPSVETVESQDFPLSPELFPLEAPNENQGEYVDPLGSYYFTSDELQEFNY